MSPTTWTAFALYLGVVLAIGVWAARRTRDARDYFVAGQRLGTFVAGIATLSAAFSGFVFLGGPGLTYRIGLGALAICVPVGLTAAMLGWVAAKRLRLLAETGEIYTVPDALAARFGGRAVSGWAAVAVLVGTVGYLGAQMLALAVLARAVLSERADAGGPAASLVVLGVGAAVLVGYSIAGGMLAGVYTDTVQGALMVVAAVAVCVRAGEAGGGWGAMLRDLAASPEFGRSWLDPLGTAPALTVLGFFFVFSIGVLGQPQMLHKFFMVRDVRSLKWMPAVIAFGQAFCLLIWLGLGLAVPALVAQGRMAPPAGADAATPDFLLAFAPDALTGLVFAGVLAAIMSTADSFLNLGSAALVRDLPRALFGRAPRRQLLWGRVATAGLGAAAAGLAWAYDDLIALLGTFAFGTFAAALAPTVAVGLNWTRVPAGAAVASIATGLLVNLGLELAPWWSAGLGLSVPALADGALAEGALPSAVALALSFAVLLAGTALGRDRSAELPAAVRTALEL